MLEWLLAMGVDEIVGEAACNRFEMVPPVVVKTNAVAVRKLASKTLACSRPCRGPPLLEGRRTSG